MKMFSIKNIKIVSAVMVLAGIAAGLCSCKKEAGEKSQKPVIIASVFPLYDWTKNIAGDAVDVKLLLKNGTDLHSWQPAAGDILLVINADAFIHVGGESDVWVKKVFDSNKQSKTRVINCMNILHDELIEEEHEDDHDELEYEEHIWLSLNNAKICVTQIAFQLSELFPEHADEFKNNADSYCAKLDELQKFCRTEIASGNLKKFVVFADRYAFAYFMRDYGVEVDAAFPGCSADTNANFETVLRLAGRIDEYNLKKVLVSETSDFKLANTVISNAKNKDVQIIVMNSMQQVVEEDVLMGESYLNLMKYNVETLIDCLEE